MFWWLSVFLFKYARKDRYIFKIRRVLINAPTGDYLSKLSQFSSIYGVSWVDICEEFMMSWEQVCEIAKDPLCTIGCHSYAHNVFRQCASEEIIQDICLANKLLSDRIGYEVSHFAYPFGSSEEVCQREVEIVKNSGFKTAVTTRSGNVFPEHDKYLHCLPRFMFTNDFIMNMTQKI